MQNIVKQIAKLLHEGRLILYPTDTVWGIGCDATNPIAVQQVFALKQRPDSKALIVFVKNEKQLGEYVETMPEPAKIILQQATRPTTIIYPKAKSLATNLIAQNGSVAIRIPKHDFCQQLLTCFGKPIVSTSANISGQPTPLHFSEITDDIKKGVDYIVDQEYEKKNSDEVTNPQPSSIILIKQDNTLVKIR